VRSCLCVLALALAYGVCACGRADLRREDHVLEGPERGEGGAPAVVVHHEVVNQHEAAFVLKPAEVRVNPRRRRLAEAARSNALQLSNAQLLVDSGRLQRLGTARQRLRAALKAPVSPGTPPRAPPGRATRPPAPSPRGS
jgi:hypothetical protein